MRKLPIVYGITYFTHDDCYRLNRYEEIIVVGLAGHTRFNPNKAVAGISFETPLFLNWLGSVHNRQSQHGLVLTSGGISDDDVLFAIKKTIKKVSSDIEDYLLNGGDDKCPPIINM